MAARRMERETEFGRVELWLPEGENPHLTVEQMYLILARIWLDEALERSSTVPSRGGWVD